MTSSTGRVTGPDERPTATPPSPSRRAGDALQVLATSPDPGTLQLRLVGELDFGNAGSLERAARHHLAPEHRTLQLHLARLRFCDCAGLVTVVDLHNAMLRRRGVLQLVAISAPVRRLMVLTQLDTVLNVAAR